MPSRRSPPSNGAYGTLCTVVRVGGRTRGTRFAEAFEFVRGNQARNGVATMCRPHLDIDNPHADGEDYGEPETLDFTEGMDRQIRA